MGQQQLLLLVLGVIIVGIAVAIGINMFSSSAVDANRDAVASQLVHLASKAQAYYKKPSTLGGGNNDFDDFLLSTSDIGTLASNCYRVEKDAAPAAAEAKSIAQETPAGTSQTIWIVGYGTETGNNGANPVMAVVTVTPTSATTAIIN